MEAIRKPFQGIGNIVRFNWHFYLLSIGSVVLILILNNYLNEKSSIYASIFCFLIVATTLISLLVSYYVYDGSELYKLPWLDEIIHTKTGKFININAGFDETSILLKDKFPNAELIVFDFYDPKKHTEISIKRARKAYPPYPNTQSIITSNIPLPDSCIDTIFVTLSAHEIRNDEERIVFFKELKRTLNQSGQIIVTEHLRDLSNFLAYNIGFFHFYSKSSWVTTFKKSDLEIAKEIKITPFISTFILKKNGTAS